MASTTTPPRRSGSLMWLWGTLGALALAAGVGVAVFYLMSYRHRQAVDAQVAEAVAAQVAAAAQQQQQGPPPATVKVGQVRERLAQQRVAVVGRLREVRRAVIASEVEGRVLELLTPTGRELVGGETVIARIDPIWSQLQVEQATADLEAAKATARQSRRELEHLLDLAQRSASDQQAIDDAQAKADADAALVVAREAALHRAQETGKRVEVVAPFDAIVTQKLTEEGQWVDPGSAVVEVVSRGLIDAVIDVPEQYITQVPVGTPIEVTVDALGQTVVGEVTAINPDGSNAARTYPVKIRIDDQGGKLKVGMSVTAQVPIRQERKYLLVPRNAVQYADAGPQVWMALVMPGSAPGSMPQAMPIDVKVVFGDGDLFAVQPLPKMPGMNLLPGMDVVTEGAELLFPTRPLVILPGGGGEQPGPGEQASAAEAAEPDAGG